MSQEEINDEIEDVIDVPQLEVQKDEQGNDVTDYKGFAEKQREIAERNRGIAQRNKTRAERFKGKLDNPEDKSDKKGKKDVGKSDELDWGQKAYLVSNGIKGAKEHALVQEQIKESGKSLDELLVSPYFQEKLKDLRDIEKTNDATPSGNGRSNQASQDSVDYWLAQPADADGNRPLPEDRILRQKVVNARIDAEKNKNVFGNS